jgi:hypothetical protein
VPEAAVNEDREPALREGDIRSYRAEAGEADRIVHSEAETASVKQRADISLWSGVAPSDGSHVA